MLNFTNPISNTELKYYLRITTTDASFNTFMTEQITAATERVFSYMQQDYSSGLAQSIVLQGSGAKVITIPWLVQKVAPGSLLHTVGAVDKQEVGSAVAAVAVDASKLRFVRGTRDLWNDDGWDKNCTYLINWTNAAFTCPRVIKQCVMKLAAYYASESRQMFGFLGRQTDYSSVAGQSAVKFIDPEEAILRMVDSYKNSGV